MLDGDVGGQAGRLAHVLDNQVAENATHRKAAVGEERGGERKAGKERRGELGVWRETLFR